MKRLVAGLGLVFGAAMTIGCGPGLSHHGEWAKSPASQDSAAAPTAVGTTTLTSASVTPLRITITRPLLIPAVQWDEDDSSSVDEYPSLQTWGKQLSAEEKYGF